MDTDWRPLILSIPTGSLARFAIAADARDFGQRTLDLVVFVAVNLFVHGGRVGAVVVDRYGVGRGVGEVEF